MKIIALAVLLATTLAVAQEKEASTRPIVYRLEYTITEMEGAKKISSRTYALQAEDGKSGSMRVGARVPVASGPADAVQYTYMDVGVNLDVTASSVSDSTNVRLKTNVDITSLITQDALSNNPSRHPPVTRSCRDQVSTIVPLDKPVVLTTQDDPSNNTSMQVQVVVKIVK